MAEAVVGSSALGLSDDVALLGGDDEMTLFDADENGMTGETGVNPEASKQSCIVKKAVGGQLKRVFEIDLHL
jgi:hypothetical protein